MELNIEHIISNSIPSKRKQIAGIYFLINKNDEIVYVGSGMCVLSRIEMHKKDNAKKFNRHFIIEMQSDSKELRMELEKRYIELLRPVYNKQCNPRYKRIKLPTDDSAERAYSYID